MLREIRLRRHNPPVLSNPEADWERVAGSASVTNRDIARRVGRIPSRWHLLSGGLANANVCLGDEVLRIYQRDPGALRKEKSLIGRRWRQFRVPRLLGAGRDFLRLEYISHEPVPATRAWGRRAGLAMAEIHATRFSSGGFLDGGLKVTRRFPDLFEALREHGEEKLSGSAGKRLGTLARPVRQTIASWSPALRRASGSPCLLHGDYKASNLHRAGNQLLILDWEFAWSGPAMMDVGQLLRWATAKPFVAGFAEGYRQGGGHLPTNWRTLAGVFDLFNLVGLLDAKRNIQKRARDIRRRIQRTLAETARP